MEFLKYSLDYFIFGVLGLMSFLLVWLAIERWLYLHRIKLDRFSHPDELNVALTRHLTTLQVGTPDRTPARIQPSGKIKTG